MGWAGGVSSAHAMLVSAAAPAATAAAAAANWTELIDCWAAGTLQNSLACASRQRLRGQLTDAPYKLLLNKVRLINKQQGESALLVNECKHVAIKSDSWGD